MNTDHPNFQPNLKLHAERYIANNKDAEALNFLRKARHSIAHAWLEAQRGNITQPPVGGLGKCHEAIMNCGMRSEALSPEELRFAEKTAQPLKNGFDQPGWINRLLACMLYLDGYQTDIHFDDFQIPPWVLPHVAAFLFYKSNWMCNSQESERYYKLQSEVNRVLHATLFNPMKNDSERNEFLQTIVIPLFQKTNFVSFYFHDRSLREECALRAEMLEYAIKVMGYATEYIFTPYDPKRKIRIGIMRTHFGPSTETFATLPVFEHLDPELFEVILYAISKVSDGPLEKYCEERAARLTDLTVSGCDPVSIIRSDDLDIFFAGTNLTASLECSILASHRLGRIQIASFCEPATSGIKKMDYYVAGELALPTNNPDQFYTEQLAAIPGSGICFSYGGTPPIALPTQRADLGIPDNAVMYISGANMLKIGRPLCESWANILSSVPESVLVLYPYNPNWMQTYPTKIFERELYSIFAQYGVDRERVIILQPRNDFSEILGILNLADVYLDGYPYAGATSIADALLAFLPTVVLEGNFLRFKQSSAIVREMALHELVAPNEDEYQNIAIALGLNKMQREEIKTRVRENLGKEGNFLDAKGCSDAMGALFAKLLRNEITH